MLSPAQNSSFMGMSGAQIEAICNEAALKAARQSKDQISAEDFEYAADRVAFGLITLKLTSMIFLGLERPSKVVSQVEKNIVAVHECGHAVVSWFLPTTDPVVKVTLIPRASSLGATQYLPSEQHLQSS